MRKARNRLKEAKSLGGRALSDLKAKRTEIPKFPPCGGDSSLYIEEIHHRADTVTAVLKEIPGYSGCHSEN
jgi:hypothetical protein